MEPKLQKEVERILAGRLSKSSDTHNKYVKVSVNSYTNQMSPGIYYAEQSNGSIARKLIPKLGKKQKEFRKLFEDKDGSGDR